MAGVMCSWYQGLAAFYHHQHMLARDLCDKSNESPSSSALLRSRGRVTFKPYSDDIESGGSENFDRRRRLLRLQPQKRKSQGKSGQLGDRGFYDNCDYDVDDRVGQVKKLKLETSSDKTLDNRKTVGNLFPELLTMIFEFLDVQSKGRVARVSPDKNVLLSIRVVIKRIFFQVCRKWRESVYRKSVWKGVVARLHIGRPNHSLYPSLVRRGIKRVQVLSLRKSLRELINGIPNLESLNLSGCYNLTDSALDCAFNRDVPALKVLNLSLCKDVSDNSLGRIATHCKNIEVLDLGGCTKVTNMGLFFISLGLKNIAKLNLRSCRQISDQGISHLAGVSHPASRASSSLIELGLQDCQKLTDESLKHISTGLINIRKINLSFCVSITDTGLKSLARLSGMNDLNLRSCDNVSDIGLSFLSDDTSFCGSSLRRLDISFCANVSDAGLKHVANGMTGLESLLMTTCAVSDEGLKSVSEKINGLRELNVGQCLGVTDDGLIILANKMKSLSTLDVYGCPKVSSKSLAALKSLPEMKNLNLAL